MVGVEKAKLVWERVGVRILLPCGLLYCLVITGLVLTFFNLEPHDPQEKSQDRKDDDCPPHYTNYGYGGQPLHSAHPQQPCYGAIANGQQPVSAP